MGKQKSLYDFDHSMDWPSQAKFPINEKTTGARVKEILLRDIHATNQLLIITGFTSLIHLVEIFGVEDAPSLQQVRIVFGFDMDTKAGKKALHFSLPTEIKNFWAKQDVSLSLCGAVINLIEKVKRRELDVRLIRHIHAKIYVGDKTAMLGSSNFSKTGIDSNQREANIRVTTENEHETQQYKSIKQLAENFFALAKDYNNEFAELLKKLFKDANWEEALARAIAEILENKWMLQYPALYKSITNSELWPTQRTGIAKALKIIQDQGSCLLADPTGSGKTRLGTALLYIIFHWMWENGRRDHSNAIIISPKQVVDSWKDARADFMLINEVVSMGQLSNGAEMTWKRISKLLHKTDILLVDEAHNYLNWGTKRSSRMQPKKSAHVVLTTATPINKKADDLLRLIELLDIDNLSDDDLKTFKKLYPFNKRKPSEDQIAQLRQYINRFIVRRTKKELNNIIKQDPKIYKNCNGQNCRYPTNNPHIYHVTATEKDCEHASIINGLLESLEGINYLQDLSLPDYFEKEEEKAKYIQRRFPSAAALAGFKIKSALRSSCPAAYEVIYGTVKATGELGYDIPTPKNPSGNIISTLEGLRKKRPVINFPAEWIPENKRWILNDLYYQAACDKEIDIYKRIGEAIKQISDTREREKVALLLQEAETSDKVIAFDATLMTLNYLHKLLCEQKRADIEIILATGQDETGKRRVRDALSHACTHDGRKVIALCSDAMSEGINLPAAKSLVLLDVPSVPRIIEQRIGRLERMDSEHEEIKVYWPEDEAPFSLKSDKRLVETLATMDLIIGNNVEIPAQSSFSRYFADKLDTWGTIEGYNRYVEEDAEWEGIQDTTSLLQNLINGNDALVKPEKYEIYKDVEASVKTAISFVESDREWSFFALRGDVQRSAKWLFIEEGKGTTDFTVIVKKLRDYLGGKDIVQRRWEEVALSRQFPKLLHFLRKHEALLLPHKKARALNVGKRLLKQFEKAAENNSRLKGQRDKVAYLLKWHEEHDDIDAVDKHHFADLWLQILQPALDEKRKSQSRKRKPISLDDLTNADIPITDEVLDFLLEEGQSASRIDEVVAACIISLRRS